MKITFKGFVGKDATLRTVTVGESQVAVLDIWVAENIRSRSTDNQKTLWHKVTIWRKYAETMAQYLKKGRRIEVDGMAEAKAYTTSDGRIVPYINVQDARIEFLDRPQEPAAPEAPAEEEDPMPEGNPFED